MGKIELVVSDNGDDGDDEAVAYVRLPGHPGPNVSGCVAKTVRLHDLLGKYTGPEINLDFDKGGQLIGIEILE